MADPVPRIAGGRVLGSFSYASTGADGWQVTGVDNLAGMTPDAVAEGARLIERVTWWDGESLASGADPYDRPRRLAWLRGGSTPRRFLIHTIHAESDGSGRPDNNYTECVAVEAWLDQAHDEDDSGRPDVRPSQLWDVNGWEAPWGPAEVALARPGQHSLIPPRPTDEVLRIVLADPTGQLRLRVLFAAVHETLHQQGPPVAGLVDDVIWGAALLDSVLGLLPQPSVWDATFDLRSQSPTAGIAGGGEAAADISLFGVDRARAGRPGVLDLTSDASPADLESALGQPQPEPCLECDDWYHAIEVTLRMVPLELGVLAHKVQSLRDAEAKKSRLRRRPPARRVDAEPVPVSPGALGPRHSFATPRSARDPIPQVQGLLVWASEIQGDPGSQGLLLRIWSKIREIADAQIGPLAASPSGPTSAGQSRSPLPRVSTDTTMELGD